MEIQLQITHLKSCKNNILGVVFWCCWRESNSRPLPYQGSALPLSYSSAGEGAFRDKRWRAQELLDGFFSLSYTWLMAEKKPQKSSKAPSQREDRLKASLKANMARRKAQAKARAAQQETTSEESER